LEYGREYRRDSMPGRLEMECNYRPGGIYIET